MSARKELVTKSGKTFRNPVEEVLQNTDFGILWTYGTRFDMRNASVISKFGWSAGMSFVDYPYAKLRDSKGEIRTVKHGEYHRAIEFASWSEFDQDEMKKQIEKLQSQIKHLNGLLDEKNAENSKLINALEELFDINEKAGPGSRKQARNIIIEAGIEICDSCGSASCKYHECDDEDEL